MNSRSAQREPFRRALRQAREDAGLSQRAVARAVDRTPSAVWQWEEGRGAPDPATVKKLEQLLNLESGTLGSLLGYATPSYLHVPAAIDAAGEKLSKQTGARAIGGKASRLQRPLRPNYRR